MPTEPTRRSPVSILLAAAMVVGLVLAPLAFPPQAPASATNAPVVPVYPRIVLTDPSTTTLGAFVKGPDGRPWYTPGRGLYSIGLGGVIVKHPYAGDATSTIHQLQRSPDGSLWFSNDYGNLLGHVTVDGTVHVYDLGDFEVINLTVTADGTAAGNGWFFAANGWGAAWVSPDGTITKVHFAASAADAITPNRLWPGPGNSIWSVPTAQSPWVLKGMFPDGHVVTAADPGQNIYLTNGPADKLSLTNQPDGRGTTLIEVDANGVETSPVPTTAHWIERTPTDTFYATGSAGSPTIIHKLSDPTFAATIPSNFLGMSGNCWQASTHTLWVSYGDGTQTTLFSVSDTGSVVPRLSDAIASGFGGCLDGPDGSLWSGYFTIRISPDDTKIETRYGTYGTTPIVTPDGLWYVAVGPVSTHGGLGYTPTEPVDVGQTYGADRYATAAAIATQSYPTTAPVVFIASGDNFPDALSAAPAAAKAGGPLLLTAANGLPASTATELKALSPSKVVLVGGTGALSAAVETRIKQIVPRASVVRTSGADRYATARAVVSSTFASAGTVWVAAGATFPDSLSAAAAAGSTGSPVVLVDGAATTIDAKTLDLIAALHPTSINVAGATGAVSAGIETQLRSIAPVTRYGGADRYATNVAIAQSVPHSVKAFVASGLLFPDALSGATWAASTHAPLYLSQRTCLPNPVLNSLVQGAPTSVTLLGGPGALNYNVAALGQC